MLNITTKRRSAPSSLYFIRTATRSLQENPGSIQAVSFLVSIQARGLSVPLMENRIYAEIFRPLIQPLQYHGSCISACLFFNIQCPRQNPRCSSTVLQVGLNK
jgi:hypothetical protein